MIVLGGGVKDLLLDRKVQFINWDQWKQIDAEEQTQGQQRGKIREKVTHFDKFIPQ